MTVYNVGAGELNDWAKKLGSRMLAIVQESTQRVVSKAQERIPVLTGFARASIVGSLSEMPLILRGNRGDGTSAYAPSYQYITAIASARLGAIIYIGWTAAYVGELEMGSSSKAPSGFVRISAMEWPRIISEVTQEARARTP